MGQAAFEVWWQLFLAGGDPDLRRTALRASLLGEMSGGVWRVAHRRWGFGPEKVW